MADCVSAAQAATYNTVPNVACDGRHVRTLYRVHTVFTMQ